jgi:DnaK suppressor protein
MARRDALLRLHKSLIAQRDELRKRLGGELRDLRSYKSLDSGDAADLAFDSGNEEVSSQLADLESRQLYQIERSLVRLKQGTYGVCEGCGKKIPVARLNALPFSTTCINCQREMETTGSWSGNPGVDWEKVVTVPAPLEEDHEVSISDLEMDVSSR